MGSFRRHLSGSGRAPGIVLTCGDEKMKKSVPAVKALSSLTAERDANSESSKSPSTLVEDDSKCNQCAKEKATKLNPSPT